MWYLNESLLLYVDYYWKTANRKQQNTDSCLSLDAQLRHHVLTVTSCSRFCIKLTHLDQWAVLKSVMSGSFFSQNFFVVHIIITTIMIQNAWKGKYWHSFQVSPKKSCDPDGTKTPESALSSSVHNLSPTLWHSLDIWRCLQQNSPSFQRALNSLRKCALHLATESW